ncbi:MAG TPA: prolyl oligopeptidase family serine peptidase, partial [Bryobacteraceae bacterium]|nr:prolyl oligopeptidase family serine peptidase [Bryobacteraceae bacterium]
RLVCFFLLVFSIGFAAPVRPVPPPGIAVPDQDRAELQAGLKRLRASLDNLKHTSLQADIQIFHDAVRYALTYGEFFKPEEISRARELLRIGQTRADDLANGKSPWASATGLITRGYVSKIDGSVQPYGLVIPPNFNPSVPWRWRLDTWFHGRGETLSELNFLYDRMHNPGEFTPPNTIVLHLYGRYCNANKFAGEVDLFEALAAVKKVYPIDEKRISIRGFSMGGAATWHIAAHHAGDWASAAPGAGFAETPVYTNMKPADIEATPWWEQKLWHWYNATDYAENLYNVPLVAYSGEIDKQKQAAEIMAAHMAEQGLTLKHVIGPQTAHKYHPESKVEIENLLTPIIERGRQDYPRHVRFTTFTLRYNRMKWVVLDALERHWDRARIEADVKLGQREVHVRTANVRGFRFQLGAGNDLLDSGGKITVVIDGQTVAATGPVSDGSWSPAFRRDGTMWTVSAGAPSPAELQKRPGLQGPIDDAFLDSFLFVLPTGTSSPATASWVKAEAERAIREWRKMWRGEARVKLDSEVTDTDISGSNLVLWGDASSNKLLARVAGNLPVTWVGDQVTVGARKFPAANHIPILIYPNPLNPARYVVLNSGPTQREADYLTNARQVPRLPDYAVVDVTTPPDERNPGKVVLGGFFDEGWRLQAGDGR